MGPKPNKTEKKGSLRSSIVEMENSGFPCSSGSKTVDDRRLGGCFKGKGFFFEDGKSFDLRLRMQSYAFSFLDLENE